MFFYSSLAGRERQEDEFEDHPEEEQEMQQSLGPSNQRVRGGASLEKGAGLCPDGAGLTFRASGPAPPGSAQPWGLRGGALVVGGWSYH